ncbi:hypothetical protein B1H18_33145 [Streptomyces tsukubensis]|uniref:Glycosyl hydrolase n=1 Tax=Streptomyces tsukubensis TaxID=83656 RepID=A0A1V4A0A7_9ACTN|nr:hypothetical protein B1H18_33145 [Streptomyces tsukubensis]
MRAVRAARRGERADRAALPVVVHERARVPGEITGSCPGPGGGLVRFTRSRLQVTVTAGGAVFLGWDGAGPLPSYALAVPCPEPDPRALLEPDTDGGLRVVSERLTVVISRHGAVEVRTPGGVMLRRDLPPRWWGGGSAASGPRVPPPRKEAAVVVEAARSGAVVATPSAAVAAKLPGTRRPAVEAAVPVVAETAPPRAEVLGVPVHTTEVRAGGSVPGEGGRRSEDRPAMRDPSSGSAVRTRVAGTGSSSGAGPSVTTGASAGAGPAVGTGATARTGPSVGTGPSMGTGPSEGTSPSVGTGPSVNTGSSMDTSPSMAPGSARAGAGPTDPTGPSTSTGPQVVVAASGVPVRAEATGPSAVSPRSWPPFGVDTHPFGAAPSGDRCVQRSEVPADAEFFGLGARASGPRLPDGTYRLWNSPPGTGKGGPTESVTMPVQMVVADAGTHLVFHDNTWDGSMMLRSGTEGAGSGHDRPGVSELRTTGGPLRYWVVPGSPARILQVWSSLTGAAPIPPDWALGHHHLLGGEAGEGGVRDAVARHRECGAPLGAVHLGAGPPRAGDGHGLPGLRRLAADLMREGVRLVRTVEPWTEQEPNPEALSEALSEPNPAAILEGKPYRKPEPESDRKPEPDRGPEQVLPTDGAPPDRLVRGTDGLPVRDSAGDARRGGFPDFTDPAVRTWWGGSGGRWLAEGVAGFRHAGDEPWLFTAYGDPTLPRSAGHVLEGRGGDHREAHNIYALCMALAAHEGARGPAGRRPWLVSRSGWAGMQRYGGVFFEARDGDWSVPAASLARVLGLGLCGVPYAGPCVDERREDSAELYLRLLQLAAYLPLLMTQATPYEQEGDQERAAEETRRGNRRWGRSSTGAGDPDSTEAAEYARAALGERRRLLPYFATLARLARLTGAPCARPVWWYTPEDRALRECGDAFLLGEALLVAPVLDPGARRRTVRLPGGRWYDTTTDRAYEGPASVTVEAPLSHIPVFARAGAVIPVRGVDGSRQLEVWAPAPGGSGGGLVIADPAGGDEGRVVVERFTVRREGDEVVVERAGRQGPAGAEPQQPGASGDPGSGRAPAFDEAPEDEVVPPVRVRGM